MRRIFIALSAAATVALAVVGFPTASSLAASSPAAATDTQPPTEPHLFAIRGLGGCEIDLRIGLSADKVTPQASIRYEVLSNGVLVPGDVITADTRGSRPGFGSLDVYGARSGGTQSFTIRAVDQAGNVSAPSNAISRNVGACG
jgi:hypothetical protein